ncbi:MAG: acyl-CoA/acyl-ACP dehydrogenase [Actinobacteria bacterium]|nr:acyl-CoA/acyl-ACP dehydrogenase [Actinomycetota bacterium]
MDLNLSEGQTEIRDVARRVLADLAPLSALSEAASGGTYDVALWEKMIALGWPSIAVPVEYGGLGLGVADLVILVEEVGYAVTASPFMSHAAATLALDIAAADDQREEWLAGCADGTHRVTMAFSVDGVADLVPDAGGADAILLVDATGAVLVTPGEMSIEREDTIDPSGSYWRVSATGGRRLPGDVEAAVCRAETVLSAYLAGLARQALDLTVEFVKERHQFGAPIGSFQAVSHRCAEMMLETERARSCVYFAAWSADADPGQLRRSAALAKAASSRAAASVTAAAIQLHGGVGFTWEADLHWLFKRAHLVAAQLGDVGSNLVRTAELAAAESERGSSETE